ncbi:MAG TPA: hypothetical protein VFO05_11635 [Candidatus Limnocylindrales bacterium]|nr:hypothetical protein [Candidatus Limnocylindrales bacterium]
MRPTRLVASAALTAALALVALPGLAGSRSPSPESVVDPAAFQPISIPANAAVRPLPVAPLDASGASAARVDAATTFVIPGSEPERVVGRPTVRQPASAAGSAQKPPRYTLRGVATFYHHGTTAMRLPRGTTVIICGDGGCIERVISDYGPIAGTNRIVDLYTPDFFDICGCPSWSGTTWVTVSVY